jgi:cytoskeletal protein CcmA (bactofilin family)
MALTISDRIKETSNTTGTGTYTLAGAVTGFETFTANLSNSDTTYYCCTDNTDFEVGLGTFTTSGTTLARTTILASSNSNNAVSWGAGTRTVFCTLPAAKTIILDASGNASVGGTITATGTSVFTNLDISGDVDVDGTLETDALTIAGVTLSETIADTVGAMVTSNTESGITVAYDDADNTLDFTVGTLNQNTTGSAATLTTPRAIGGVNFDGSAAINLPGVDAAGNQNTSGTAAVATAVTVSDNESTNENNVILFGAGAAGSGTVGVEADGNMTYNPSTGKITATGFIGALTGDVTGNLTGTVATATQNSITTATGLTSTGALNAGSITSGFGAIDNGASAITTTGVGSFGSLDISGDVDVDGTLEADAITLNGTTITATATLAAGISNTNVAQFGAGVADDDFLRVNGTTIEGRSASEVVSDIGAATLDDATALAIALG